MKTLVRPQTQPIIAISPCRLIQKKLVRNQNFYVKDNKKIISYLLLFISFSVFLFLPESPKLSETICTNHNPQSVCNIW